MTDFAPELQYPPRAIDAAARKRAWSEPSVRSWLLLAVALALVAAGLFTDTVFRHRSDAELISSGLKVDARVMAIEHDIAPGHKTTAQPPRVISIEYDVSGTTHKFAGYLPGFDTGIAEIGGKLPIRVDPGVPERFTCRLAPEPLFAQTVALIFLPPLIGMAAIVAAHRRRRLLATWHAGDLVTAVVMDTRSVAVAPSTISARCMPTDERDRRVFTVFVPRVAEAPVSRGSVLCVIALASGRGPAVSAAWFDRRALQAF